MLSLALPAALFGQERGPAQPLPDGWWRLSLEQIRAGESWVDPDQEQQLGFETPAPATPAVNPKAGQRTGSLSLLPKTGTAPADEGSATSAGVRMERGESARETTRREFATATTRQLQQMSTTGTNLFRSLDPIRPIRSLEFNPFNRPEPAEAAAASSSGGAHSPRAILPGPATYAAPSSPLDVVNSSVQGPSLQYLPNPFVPLPVLPSEPAREGTTPAHPTDGRPETSPSKPSSDPVRSAAGTNQATSAQAGKPSAPPLPPRAPTRDGKYYEPKSISDLQMGR